VNYGVSESLLGPVKYLYPVLEKKSDEDILGTGHHSIVKVGEDYYMAYHRFATPTRDYPEGKGFHREVCMDKLEFDAQGYMKKVKVTK
jgi:hypothetical protein